MDFWWIGREKISLFLDKYRKFRPLWACRVRNRSERFTARDRSWAIRANHLNPPKKHQHFNRLDNQKCTKIKAVILIIFFVVWLQPKLKNIVKTSYWAANNYVTSGLWTITKTIDLMTHYRQWITHAFIFCYIRQIKHVIT